MVDGDFYKSFGSVDVRQTDGKLIVRESARQLPKKIIAHFLIFVTAGAGALYFFLWQGKGNSFIAGVFELIGLILAAIFAIAWVSLIQMLVMFRYPIVIDRSKRTAGRGKRVQLEGKFRAEMKRLSAKTEEGAFHVRLVQKDQRVFVWRAPNEDVAREMVTLINLYLKPSLTNTEVGEDPFDHIG